MRARPAHLRSLAAVVATVIALATSACGDGGGGAPEARPVVVVLQSPDLPDGLAVVSPAVLGLTLALADGPLRVQVVPADPAGSSAASAARDPRVVGVVVAPFTIAGDAALRSLADAGVPVLSLSSLDDPISGTGEGSLWRRWVPDAETSAVGTLEAAGAASATGCILEEPGAWSDRFGARLEAAGGPHGWAASSDVGGCAAIVWSGSAAGATALRARFDGPMILTEQARTQGFLDATRASVGLPTIGTCACKDVTTSARPRDQAFVHAYQLASGLDPGPYALEGYDVGAFLLAAATGPGGPTRAAVVAALGSQVTFEGVAAYGWEPSGELNRPGIRIYRAEGVRWLPAGGVG
jgi:hypothetical protein